MRFMEFILERYKIIGIVIIILFVVHILFGKPRWQVYPLYLVMVIYFVMAILNNNNIIDISSNTVKWTLGIGVFLFFISIVSLIVFPIEEIPKPSGKYSIGTRTYDLVDTSRDAVYSDSLSENRKIKFQIWYPTEITEGYEKVKWIEDGTILTRQLASSMHFPSFMLDQTAFINSNSYKNAPISNSLNNYPVVIISHGWLGFRELHTDFAEELASHGYIAISIDHTYGSQAVKFENGDIAYLKPEALPNADSTSSFAEYADKLVTTYGQDIISVLDDLEDLNMDPDFKDKLNLDKIGLLGHSTGGGGDVYASLKDKRVKAVLGLDAWIKPIESQFEGFGLSIPSLFIRSEQWSSVPNDGSLKYLVNHSSNSNFFQIDGTTHVDFSMAYMYSPLSKLVGFTGKLEGREASEIQREFILSFFNEYLKDKKDHNELYIEEIVKKHDSVRYVKIN